MKLFRGVLVALALGWSGLSVQAAVDVNALIRDLNQQKGSSSQMKLVFWLPPEYFFATAPGGDSPEQQKRLHAMLDGHVLFLAADGEIGAVGAFHAKSRADVLASSRLEIDGGPPLSPLQDADVKGDLKMLAAMLKPMFKNLLGNLGEAIEPVVFRLPSTSRRSNELALKEGRMTMRMGGETFSWRTPLGSLLPPAIDSETGEDFPGNFLYNPYTGRRLSGN